MKKEVCKYSIEEISIEEAVKDFCEECEECYCRSIDSEDFDSELDDFIEENIKEISSEERDTLKEEIKKKLIKQKEEFIVQEKSKLKNRTSILKWIDYNIKYDNCLEGGDVGYYLSAKEILDLIIKNGKK